MADKLAVLSDVSSVAQKDDGMADWKAVQTVSYSAVWRAARMAVWKERSWADPKGARSAASWDESSVGRKDGGKADTLAGTLVSRLVDLSVAKMAAGMGCCWAVRKDAHWVVRWAAPTAGGSAAHWADPLDVARAGSTVA
jgi:hypothetical protein